MTTDADRVPSRLGEAYEERFAHNGGYWEDGFGNAPDERFADMLGWVSLGLGLLSLAAPHRVARLIGVNDERENVALLRAVGLREIASGTGILSQRRPVGWVWSRVAGDMMDLALLSSALRSDDSDKNRVAATTAAVLGIAALDALCAQQLARTSTELPPASQDNGTVVTLKAITTTASAEQAYAFWRDFQNIPRFMEQIESCQVLADGRSHWRAVGPAGMRVEWDAEVVEDRPNELISWRSLPGADVMNSGTVRFVPAPAGRGTEVRVELRYEPPAGKVGVKVAKLFVREPGQQLFNDLRHFKQILETGEIVRSSGAIAGSHPVEHPAQPVRMAA